MPEARIDDMKTLLMFLKRSMMTSDTINCDARMAADTFVLKTESWRELIPYPIVKIFG